jgi:CRP/FNR family transcriptional regulator, cyclic AMP receptor protein
MKDVRWEAIDLFRELSPDEIETVKPYFETMTVETGQNVIAEGERGDDMFILVEGRVRVSKSMVMRGLAVPILETEDPRKVLASMSADEHPFFGEMALLDQDTRSATVTTLETCEFLRISRERFFALIECCPTLGVKLLMALCRRLAGVIRRNNGELIKLTTALALIISRKK